jgi:hypothetical protein
MCQASHFFRYYSSAIAVLVLCSFATLRLGWAEEAAPTDQEKGETIYKKVGPDGEVIYSDNPLPDSKEVKVPQASGYKPVKPPPAFTPYQPPEKKSQAKPQVKLSITSPKQDEVIWGVQDQISVTVDLEPGLAAGEQLEYLIDGKSVLTGSATSYTFSKVYRGTHTLEVRLIDHAGNSILSQKVTFHMHRFQKK